MGDRAPNSCWEEGVHRVHSSLMCSHSHNAGNYKQASIYVLKYLLILLVIAHIFVLGHSVFSTPPHLNTAWLCQHSLACHPCSLSSIILKSLVPCLTAWLLLCLLNEVDHQAAALVRHSGLLQHNASAAKPQASITQHSSERTRFLMQQTMKLAFMKNLSSHKSISWKQQLQNFIIEEMIIPFVNWVSVFCFFCFLTKKTDIKKAKTQLLHV